MQLNKEEILKLNNDGLNISEIAVCLDVSYKTLYRYCKSNNIVLTKTHKTKKIKESEFLEYCSKKFKNKYIYSNFVSLSEDVEVYCTEHKTKNLINANKHYLSKNGLCACCNDNFDVFLRNAKNKFGDKFGYDKVQYSNDSTKIEIFCNKHKQYFFQTPNSHLRGKYCCPFCIKEEKFVMTTSELKKRIFDKFDDRIIVVDSDKKNAKFKCSIHGIFRGNINNILKSVHGCPLCKENGGRLSFESAVKKFENIHGKKYKYSKNKYKGINGKIKIKCKKHGWFYQNGKNHSNGHGCPKCSSHTNKFENEVIELIKKYNISVIERDRMVLNGQEIDMFLPDLNIGFEFNGLFFHREGLITKKNMSISGKSKHYHVNKTNSALNKGINLYQINEDEWIKNKELVVNRILNICGISKSTKTNARDLTVVTVSKKEKDAFLKKYHIQGTDISKYCYGLEKDGKLLSVMTFKDKKNGCYELNRYAANTDYSVRGGAGKLLTYFIKQHSPSTITTFADRRWTPNANGCLYDKLGFKLIETQQPAYHYVEVKNPIKTYNRLAFQKHKILKNFPNLNPTKTEKELMIELGYDRIWDCGNFKFQMDCS